MIPTLLLRSKISMNHLRRAVFQAWICLTLSWKMNSQATTPTSVEDGVSCYLASTNRAFYMPGTIVLYICSFNCHNSFSRQSLLLFSYIDKETWAQKLGSLFPELSFNHGMLWSEDALCLISQLMSIHLPQNNVLNIDSKNNKHKTWMVVSGFEEMGKEGITI